MEVPKGRDPTRLRPIIYDKRKLVYRDHSIVVKHHRKAQSRRACSKQASSNAPLTHPSLAPSSSKTPPRRLKSSIAQHSRRSRATERDNRRRI